MRRNMGNGIYLIIDPSIDRDILLGKLKAIVEEKITAVQIWDNFKANENPIELVNEVVGLCHSKDIPVIINNQWEILKHSHLDGIHFDSKPENIQQIRKEINRDIITGITCNNDLSIVKWADENELDYISFCSMFQSSTANSCELVSFDTVKATACITSLPVFLAGGIKPENIGQLNELNYAGIAVVSGVMDAAKPAEEIKKYLQKLKKVK